MILNDFIRKSIIKKSYYWFKGENNIITEINDGFDVREEKIGPNNPSNDNRSKYITIPQGIKVIKIYGDNEYFYKNDVQIALTDYPKLYNVKSDDVFRFVYNPQAVSWGKSIIIEVVR